MIHPQHGPCKQQEGAKVNHLNVTVSAEKGPVCGVSQRCMWQAQLRAYEKEPLARKTGAIIAILGRFPQAHLEYCVQAWGVYMKGDIRIQRKPQRRFTRRFAANGELP